MFCTKYTKKGYCILQNVYMFFKMLMCKNVTLRKYKFTSSNMKNM